jgi:hypothetical protein
LIFIEYLNKIQGSPNKVYTLDTVKDMIYYMLNKVYEISSTPKTNYKHILDMSVDELATFLLEIENRRSCNNNDSQWNNVENVKRWLESEVIINEWRLF